MANEENCYPQSKPILQFSRFKNGALEVFDGNTIDFEYVAISHVWGDVEWRKFAGKETLVPVSSVKANFILNRLPELVGETPFWMDILNVNQTDKAERIAVTKWIPDIFRNATRTIAVRENDGIYECCAEVLGNTEEQAEYAQAFIDHISEHRHRTLNESYLQRLWTLQECLLSPTVQFVLCSNDKPEKVRFGVEYSHRYPADVARILDSLYVLAYVFSGTTAEDDFLGFMKACIGCGTVSARSLPERTADQDLHSGTFLSMNQASDRTATKPRDYVLATAPQFAWYEQPHAAKDMLFGHLFADLWNQAFAAGHRFACRITRSMVDPTATCDEAWSPSPNQPEPRCLGDFLKLIGGRLDSLGISTGYVGHLASSIYIVEYTNDHPNTILDLLDLSMEFSPIAWSLSETGGELHTHGSTPSCEWELRDWDAAKMGWRPLSEENERCVRIIEEGDDTILSLGRGWFFEECEELLGQDLHEAAEGRDIAQSPCTTLLEQSRQILALMWTSRDGNKKPQASAWRGFRRDMQGRWPKPLIHTMLLLAGMIGCGIGLSAGEWVNRYFVPSSSNSVAAKE